MTTKPKKDVYQIVSDHVIVSLELGIIPWRVSWVKGGVPSNVLTQKPYRGVNVPLLAMQGYEKNVFVSEQQLTNLGGTAKKEERPYVAVYWEWKDGFNGSEEKRPVLLYERVYNIVQCEGLSEAGMETATPPDKPLKVCKEMVKGMPTPPKIEYNQQSAFYAPLEDVVHMPPSEEYKNPELYYFELFKMLIHATGHANRLDRKELAEMEPLTKDVFSREELIADIGAHYLCFYAGITGILSLPDTRYIFGWLEKFNDDARLFVFACTQAQKAVDYILNAGAKADTQPENSTQQG